MLNARLQVDDEGFLLDRSRWTPEVAELLARNAGIDRLTDKHWKVLSLCREESARGGCLTGAGAISRLAALDEEQLRELFPGDPARLAARIAGLPRPITNEDRNNHSEEGS